MENYEMREIITGPAAIGLMPQIQKTPVNKFQVYNNSGDPYVER